LPPNRSSTVYIQSSLPVTWLILLLTKRRPVYLHSNSARAIFDIFPLCKSSRSVKCLWRHYSWNIPPPGCRLQTQQVCQGDDSVTVTIPTFSEAFDYQMTMLVRPHFANDNQQRRCRNRVCFS